MKKKLHLSIVEHKTIVHNFKLICVIAFSLLFHYPLDCQNRVQKIDRENLIGEKIKFLRSNDITEYKYFNKPKSYSSLDYNEFHDRIATFMELNKEESSLNTITYTYKLKMDDNYEVIYLRISDTSDIPNTVGILSLLDSARSKYLNKTYYDKQLQFRYKIKAIEFSELKGRFLDLSEPYDIFYTLDNDTTIRSMSFHFTDTYKGNLGYMSETEKKHVFEYYFTFENPFATLKKENINDKFVIDIDKMDNNKTYIHKNFIDEDCIKYNLGYQLYWEKNSILSKVTVNNGYPRISFISNYYSSDWIFHTNIKIKIGNTTKQTTIVHGLRNVLGNGKVNETNYYKTQVDLEILKWIAGNYQKEILVRFNGRDYYEDITMTMLDKLALKETYDLYILLKKK